MKPKANVLRGRLMAFVCLFMLALCGCQSNRAAQTVRSESVIPNFSAMVPLPDETPFDADPKARTAYLSAYQDGYRSGLTQLNIIFGKPPGGFATYSNARMQGWDAGMEKSFSIPFQEPSAGKLK